MPLPVPNLDDRTFQDLVNEARRRIPLYCPEWTDHNLSDPGITLIELFSWMTELIIYRLNKVPDKTYIKFLELLGLELHPTNPAGADITFRLTAARPHYVMIPRGTEVATVRTETQEAIIFTVEEDLTVVPPAMEYFLVSRDESRFDDRMPTLREWAGLAAEGGMVGGTGEPDSFYLFHSLPEPGNAFYLGFNSNLSSLVVSLTLNCDETEGRGVNPVNPPIKWEYWDRFSMDWQPFQRRPESVAWLESDGTRGLNTQGQVILHIPASAGMCVVDQRRAFWIRCVVTPSAERQGVYEASPRVRAVVAESVGGTALARNAVWVSGELLETSNGRPGQVMTVSRVPMLPLEPDEHVEVQSADDAGWESWEQVPDFSQAGPDDRVFVCDPVNGEIQFGPVVRSASGEEVRYGAVPFAGSQVRISGYRYGGGPRGNVGSRTLTVLKSSIPYVASVVNRRNATGGMEPESIDEVKIRGPKALQTLNRAVTQQDYEYLAKEASQAVGRAKCVQPQEVGAPGSPPPGVIELILVPALPAYQRQIRRDELHFDPRVLEEVRAYLDQRRMLACAVVVAEPDYIWVSVEAQVKVRQGADLDQVRQAVEERLYRYINPVNGGADGQGWPFGRPLFASELYSQIQTVPDLEYVQELNLYPIHPMTGDQMEATQRVSVPATGLLCSATHNVIASRWEESWQPQ